MIRSRAVRMTPEGRRSDGIRVGRRRIVYRRRRNRKLGRYDPRIPKISVIIVYRVSSLATGIGMVVVVVVVVTSTVIVVVGVKVFVVDAVGGIA